MLFSLTGEALSIALGAGMNSRRMKKDKCGEVEAGATAGGDDPIPGRRENCLGQWDVV